MAHDVSSISFPLTHRVNVFGLVLFVINGTSKAQCDTFLRIWVCQGHINIINEQEADWREMEWQREGWGSKQEGDIYFCQFCDIYLPVILIMIAFAQPLWVMERQFVPRDLERLPTISLVYRDGWMAAFFFHEYIWKITSTFALSCPVAKNSEVYKGNFYAHLYEDSYIYLGM